MPDIEQASNADVSLLAGTLAAAFADDPAFAHMLPPSRVQQRLHTFFVSDISSFLKRDKLVLKDASGRGAALWAPPDAWKVAPRDLAANAPAMMRVFGRRLPRALGALRRVEARHPAEPHWYLAVLGTAPRHQGLGIGGALITAVTDLCDAEGLPAYLESSKPANVPYYERFGFKVTEEVGLPGGGPPIWLMWREPRG